MNDVETLLADMGIHFWLMFFNRVYLPLIQLKTSQVAREDDDQMILLQLQKASLIRKVQLMILMTMMTGTFLGMTTKSFKIRLRKTQPF